LHEYEYMTVKEETILNSKIIYTLLNKIIAVTFELYRKLGIFKNNLKICASMLYNVLRQK